MPYFYPYIKPNYKSKENLTPVYVRYDYDRLHRTLISTGISIDPLHWDSNKRTIKRSCPDQDKVIEAINNISTRLGQLLQFAQQHKIEPTVEYINKALKGQTPLVKKDQTRSMDLFTALDAYMVAKRTKVSDNQIKDYRTLRKHLENFRNYSSQPISFEALNRLFYDEFMDYLSYKAIQPKGTIGLLTNSAGKVIRLLRGFVNYQIASGAIEPIDLQAFKVITEETDTIYLSEFELKAIASLDLDNDQELMEVRDLLLVGCYTGLRFSDLSVLSPDQIDIKNGTIHLKQRKVHRAVVIPLIDYVPGILAKYGYALPRLTNHKFNERVKELGRLAKINQRIEIVRKRGNQRVVSTHYKYELISSHTCRRSFCTNMFLSGFPAEELMKISGHKNPAAFMRYIRVDGHQAADRLKKHRAQIKRRANK